MRFVMAAAVGAMLAVACAKAGPAPDVASHAGSAVATTVPEYNAVGFKAGDSVRVKSRSGTFKPSETGHVAEVNATAGKTGVVVQGIGEIARVRFDAQTWEEFPPTGAIVDLKPFEATVHISYLERLR